MKNKLQPKRVMRIVCPRCGELQIKIFPWSSIMYQTDKQIPLCGKCLGKNLNK